MGRDVTAGPRVAFVIWASTKSPLLHSMENKNHLGLLDTGNDAESLMVPQANFSAFFFVFCLCDYYFKQMVSILVLFAF